MPAPKLYTIGPAAQADTPTGSECRMPRVAGSQAEWLRMSGRLLWAFSLRVCAAWCHVVGEGAEANKPPSGMTPRVVVDTLVDT